jgi:hypothetical protein
LILIQRNPKSADRKTAKAPRIAKQIMMFLYGPSKKNPGEPAPTGLANRPTGAPSKKDSHPSLLKILI